MFFKYLVPRALFVAALCACAHADAAVAPIDSPPTGALDGVYLGLKQSGVTGSLYDDYWTFFPDGRVMRYGPDEGLDRPIDYARTCARNVCGTYTRDGSTLRIRWAGDGQDKAYDLDAQGAFAEHGKTQKYRPLASLTGMRLAATYAVVDTVNAITLMRLQLTADGHFTETRLMTHTFWEQLAPPGETRVALPGGSGTYTVARNTLTLRYDGGPTAYFFLVVPPGESGKAVPDAIYINEAHIDRER